jgi:UDP-sugar transporter A1/2/3
MAEVVKLGVCLIIVYIESGGIVQLFDTIDKQIIQQPMDTLKVCVPSFVYVIQNNLLYVSASHLDAATYQVCTFIFSPKQQTINKLLSRSRIN